MSEHGKRGIAAKELFERGYNCAQAVLLAFSDMTGLDCETSAKLASSFGGGMGRMREVCGAVSGIYMVLGLVDGYSSPDDRDGKSSQYAVVRKLAERFICEHGSIICREMLAGVETSSGGEPEARTSEYYKKRPCGEIIADAADILDDYLSEVGLSSLS